MTRYLLSPRLRPAYGQDIIQSATEEALRLRRVTASPDQRYEVDYSNATLVASHDLTYRSNRQAFLSGPPTLARIAHVHLQWGYSPEKARAPIGRALQTADAVVVPADFLRHELEQHLPGLNVHVVRNGVDKTVFKPMPREERLAHRREIGVPDEAALYCHVGKFELSKGLEILQAAISLLNGTARHVLLQFPTYLGTEHTQEFQKGAAALQSLAPGHVHLWPDPDPQSFRPVRFCDALLHPSLSEVAPLTVIEALASGVAVIATGSTAFYDEIDLGDGVRVVSLPPAIDWATRPQQDLRIDAPEVATEVARRMLDDTRDFARIEDSDRAAVASRVIDQGFSVASMISSLSTIYDAVEMSKSTD